MDQNRSVLANQEVPKRNLRLIREKSFPQITTLGSIKVIQLKKVRVLEKEKKTMLQVEKQTF